VDLERFRVRLRYFAARRLRDWAEAEDVAQEALRRTLEALTAGRVEDPKALSSFLFQTAEHICQHRALSAGREKRALHLFASSSKAESQEHGDPLGSLISAERGAEVRRALETLDSGDREILALTYVEALRSSEIADRLRLTEGNVRVRRHRALQRLARLLGVTDGEDRGPEK
jgi:RNA polymerase sigma-70 factor (ECF subfamily)